MEAKRNARCPLCGGPNGCAPARTGELATPCWCRDVTIAADVLARIPAAQRDEACICAKCAGVEVLPVA